jgi:hypothetical protein
VRRFTRGDFEAFFRLIDAELAGPCTIVLIGGGAIGCAYRGSHATSDLDLWSASDAGFWAAAERANSKSAERIPVEKAAIAEPPYDFEDRLTRLSINGLSKLTILVPEAHDLTLMKVARAEAHDLDGIEDIHRAHPLSLDTLTERYLDTRTQVIGSLESHRLNFLAAVARLFGEDAAVRLDATLQKTLAVRPRSQR